MLRWMVLKGYDGIRCWQGWRDRQTGAVEAKRTKRELSGKLRIAREITQCGIGSECSVRRGKLGEAADGDGGPKGKK